MQSEVSAFLKTHGLQLEAEKRYIDLVSEIGELGKELLLATNYGTKPPEYSGKMQGELGDCLFSLLSLCDALGVDAETALAGALEKYEKRASLRGNIGSDVSS